MLVGIPNHARSMYASSLKKYPYKNPNVTTAQMLSLFIQWPVLRSHVLLQLGRPGLS